jgi:tRNA pseudouridine55 synthase
VELAPRAVTIHNLRLVEYRYPLLRLEISCSSGTYVRSLGRDVAAQLGTMAVMSALTRTSVGGFQLKEAVRLETLASQGAAAYLLPATRATEALPRICLTENQIDRVRQGMKVELSGAGCGPEVAAVDGRGQLVAILSPRGTGWWGPVCNL